MITIQFILPWPEVATLVDDLDLIDQFWFFGYYDHESSSSYLKNLYEIRSNTDQKFVKFNVHISDDDIANILLIKYDEFMGDRKPGIIKGLPHDIDSSYELSRISRDF